jgi:hypothetical protein
MPRKWGAAKERRRAGTTEGRAPPPSIRSAAIDRHRQLRCRSCLFRVRPDLCPPNPKQRLPAPCRAGADAMVHRPKPMTSKSRLRPRSLTRHRQPAASPIARPHPTSLRCTDCLHRTKPALCVAAWTVFGAEQRPAPRPETASHAPGGGYRPGKQGCAARRGLLAAGPSAMQPRARSSSESGSRPCASGLKVPAEVVPARNPAFC